MKKEIKIGNITIGGNNPIIIQSMTNIKTSNIKDVVNQINALSSKGAKIIRLAVADENDALSIKEIKKQVSVPLVADIHFDYKLALLSIENGADKIRINPGNIKKENLIHIINKAKEYNIPIRIGVNSGSLEKELYDKYGVTTTSLYESLINHIKFFEDNNFTNLVLSVKSTDIQTNYEVNKLIYENTNYPIHIGLTESGSVKAGIIRSSYALGTLIKEGIGNTIRVSLTGDPINEIGVAKEILSMFNKYDKPTLICCPTCGRTQYDMEPIVNEIEEFLNTINTPLKVAIMGCAVNGPGEARDADIGIAGGVNEALLFKKGTPIKKVPQDQIINVLKQEIIEIIKSR